MSLSFRTYRGVPVSCAVTNTLVRAITTVFDPNRPFTTDRYRVAQSNDGPINAKRGSGLTIPHALVSPLSPIRFAGAGNRAIPSSPFLLSVPNPVEFRSLVTQPGWL